MYLDCWLIGHMYQVFVWSVFPCEHVLNLTLIQGREAAAANQPAPPADHSVSKNLCKKDERKEEKFSACQIGGNLLYPSTDSRAVHFLGP